MASSTALQQAAPVLQVGTQEQAEQWPLWLDTLELGSRVLFGKKVYDDIKQRMRVKKQRVPQPIYVEEQTFDPVPEDAPYNTLMQPGNARNMHGWAQKRLLQQNATQPSVSYSNVLGLNPDSESFSDSFSFGQSSFPEQENKSKTRKGKGTYGTVFAFTNKTDLSRYGMQTVFKQLQDNFLLESTTFYSELAIGRMMTGLPNMVPFLGAFFQPIVRQKPETKDKKDAENVPTDNDDESLQNYRIGFVLPAACSSLSDIWRSTNPVKLVSETRSESQTRCVWKEEKMSAHFPALFYQMVRSLALLHSHGIMHRDIKPDNFLLLAERDKIPYVMLADFGISLPKLGPECNYSSAAGTETYRSPELMLAHDLKKESYCVQGFEQDIWSLGMSFIELATKKRFVEHYPFYKQAEKITPRMTALFILEQFHALKVQENKVFEVRFKDKKNKLPEKFIPVLTDFPWNTPLFLDLLTAMLQVNPKNRITAKEALAHEYFDSVREQVEEAFPLHQGTIDSIFYENLGNRQAQLERLICSSPKPFLKKFFAYPVIDIFCEVAYKRKPYTFNVTETHQLAWITANATAMMNFIECSKHIHEAKSKLKTLMNYLAIALSMGICAPDLNGHMALIGGVFEGTDDYLDSMPLFMDVFHGEFLLPNLYSMVWEQLVTYKADTIHLINTIIMGACSFYNENSIQVVATEYCLPLIEQLGLGSSDQAHRKQHSKPLDYVAFVDHMIWATKEQLKIDPSAQQLLDLLNTLKE